MKRFLQTACVGAAIAGFGGVAQADSILSLIKASGATSLDIKLQNFDNGVLYPVGTNAGGVVDTPGGSAALTAAIAAMDGVAGQAPATGSVAGDDSWGIYRVTDIFDSATNTLIWNFNQDMDAGAAGVQKTELTGIFYGLKDYHIQQIAGALSVIDAVDLKVDFYEQFNPGVGQAFDPSLGSGGRTGLDDYTTATDGALVLSTVGEGGHINAAGDLGGARSEFQSFFNSTSLAGTGTAFLSVVGGAWADHFDTDPFTGQAAGFSPADLKLTFTTVPNAGPAIGDWLVKSNDPIQASFDPLPTPSAGLAGILLYGFIGMARRRRVVG